MLCARDPDVPVADHSSPAAGRDVLVLAVDEAGTREALEVAVARACALGGRVVLAGPLVRPFWWALAAGSWMMSPQASPAELADTERERLVMLARELDVVPAILCCDARPQEWVPLLLDGGGVGLVLIGAAGRTLRIRRRVRSHRRAVGERCDLEVLPVAARGLERGLARLVGNLDPWASAGPTVWLP
jgi:hypothetical protein